MTIDYESLRMERHWPTPNHMRSAADALDIFTPARYGDVLRWVADRCDDSLVCDALVDDDETDPAMRLERLLRRAVRALSFHNLTPSGRVRTCLPDCLACDVIKEAAGVEVHRT